MSKFKAGQKVIVRDSGGTNSSDYFKAGDILTVSDEEAYDEDQVNVLDKDGNRVGGPAGWYESRFNLYEEPTPKVTLDLTKPVETKAGVAVTLITTQARGDYPVKGYVGDSEGLEGWKLDGKYLSSGSNSVQDLRNVAPKPLEREVYMNVYKDFDDKLFTSGVHATKAVADGNAVTGRVSCIKVKLVEGVFDN